MAIGQETRSLQSRLALPVGILVATHLVGILGYHWLWRDLGGTWMDALFMTFTTVATIGYGEVKPLDDAGRLFTIAIAVTRDRQPVLHLHRRARSPHQRLGSAVPEEAAHAGAHR